MPSIVAIVDTERKIERGKEERVKKKVLKE